MRDGVRHEKTWERAIGYALVRGNVAAGVTAAVLMMDAGVSPAAAEPLGRADFPKRVSPRDSVASRRPARP